MDPEGWRTCVRSPYLYAMPGHNPAIQVLTKAAVSPATTANSGAVHPRETMARRSRAPSKVHVAAHHNAVLSGCGDTSSSNVRPPFDSRGAITSGMKPLLPLDGHHVIEGRALLGQVRLHLRHHLAQRLLQVVVVTRTPPGGWRPSPPPSRPSAEGLPSTIPAARRLRQPCASCMLGPACSRHGARASHRPKRRDRSGGAPFSEPDEGVEVWRLARSDLNE
jgi:hypothetical protein